MAITLELRPDLEERLKHDAEAAGLSIAGYVEQLLDIEAPPARKAPPKTYEEYRARIDPILAKLDALPRLDNRTADEIIGFDEYGIPLP